jgi:hypothetical protein
VIGAREVLSYVECLSIAAFASVLAVDVVKDEQLSSVVRAREPNHDVPYYRINVSSAAVTSISPACLRNLA